MDAFILQPPGGDVEGAVVGKDCGDEFIEGMFGVVEHGVDLFGFSTVHVFPVLEQPIDAPGAAAVEAAHTVIGISDFVGISF